LDGGRVDGADVESRYWDDDKRHFELEKYSHLSLVADRNGDKPAKKTGHVVGVRDRP
jgi:hypothetical protein